MYLCVCKAISERTARRAIQAGEVASVRDMCRQLSVGTCCGKCVPDARALLDGELTRLGIPADVQADAMLPPLWVNAA